MKKIIFLVVVALSCSGCFTNYEFVSDKYPVISKPEKPSYTISADPTVLEVAKIARDWNVYANQLEYGIDVYNDYANAKNEKYEASKKYRDPWWRRMFK